MSKLKDKAKDIVIKVQNSPFKFDWKLVLLILAVLFIWQQCNRSSNLKKDLQDERKEKAALIDSTKIMQDEKLRLVSSNLTIQADLKSLKRRFKEDSTQFKGIQRTLINEVSSLQKENKKLNRELIAAGVVDGGVNIGEDNNIETESLVYEGDSSLNFEFNSDSISFKINIVNVRPFDLDLPSRLAIQSLVIPNEQLVTFNFEKDKQGKDLGFPVSFTVRNSNPLYKTYDIESYAIPELTKENVNPNFWQKLKAFSKTTGGRLLFFGIGFGVGAVVVSR
jgi:hypothetical protein